MLPCYYYLRPIIPQEGDSLRVVNSNYLEVVGSNYLLSMMTDSGSFVETTFTRPCLDLNLPCDRKG